MGKKLKGIYEVGDEVSPPSEGFLMSVLFNGAQATIFMRAPNNKSLLQVTRLKEEYPNTYGALRGLADAICEEGALSGPKFMPHIPDKDPDDTLLRATKDSDGDGLVVLEKCDYTQRGVVEITRSPLRRPLTHKAIIALIGAIKKDAGPF